MVTEETIEEISKRYEALKEHLNERQVRLWAGAEAQTIGHGGLTAVARATGLSAQTVKAGLEELEEWRKKPEEEKISAIERQRKAGGGRQKAQDKMPGLLEALNRLIEPTTRGEPDSPLRWTTKSTTNLAKALRDQGYEVSADTVGRLLKEQDYSLQSTRKRFEGKQHPDRDAQFQYIAKKSQEYMDEAQPVVSVDTKNKQLVGNFQAKGREWQKEGQPIEVEAYDFASMAEGKAVPYGVYELQNNEGWVSVGMSANTAEFAVNTLEQWYQQMGRERFPNATKLLVTADSGGANGSRNRLWKSRLQEFANRTGLEVTVLHYPPGTSKWNKIEHRMFNHITMNWRGRPLTSFEVIVQCIAQTTTSQGLHIRSALDQNTYNTGIQITPSEMSELSLVPHSFHPEWNYTFFSQK